MWPNNPFSRHIESMERAVKNYRSKNSKAKTIKYISREYGYTITGAVRYLLNIQTGLNATRG